jgi:hypothetical protein
LPAPRTNAHAVYDPVQNRVLVLGGFDNPARGQVFQELWAMTPGQEFFWVNISPAGGTQEPYSAEHLMLDGTRLIAFDRVDYGAWVLDLAAATPAWAKLAPPSPPPAGATGVSGASVIFDHGLRRLLVFGGRSAAGLPTNGLFALSVDSPNAWIDLSAAFGTPPPPTSGPEAVLSSSDEMVVLESPHDAWSLPVVYGSMWTHLKPTGVPPIDTSGRVPIFDSTRGRIIWFGSVATPSGSDASPAAQFSFTTWTLSLIGAPAWSQLATAQNPPARSDFAAAYDSTADRVILFGGLDVQGQPLNDVWALNLGQCQ